MVKNQVKILVGVPTGSSIMTRTAQSLLQWQSQRIFPSNLVFKQETVLEKARNELVWQAVEMGATHLMCIDSDMVFKPDAIDTLVSRNKDIIGGVYYGRMMPKRMVFRIEDEMPQEIDISKEEDVFEVDFVATGFLLINMRVFTKMEPPFFKMHWTPEDFGIKKRPFPQNFMGEDAYFCLSAKQKGFSVWADQTIPLGHVGTHMYHQLDHEAWEEMPELYDPSESKIYK